LKLFDRSIRFVKLLISLINYFVICFTAILIGGNSYAEGLNSCNEKAKICRYIPKYQSKIGLIVLNANRLLAQNGSGFPERQRFNQSGYEIIYWFDSNDERDRALAKLQFLDSNNEKQNSDIKRPRIHFELRTFRISQTFSKNSEFGISMFHGNNTDPYSNERVRLHGKSLEYNFGNLITSLIGIKLTRARHSGAIQEEKLYTFDASANSEYFAEPERSPISSIEPPGSTQTKEKDTIGLSFYTEVNLQDYLIPETDQTEQLIHLKSTEITIKVLDNTNLKDNLFQMAQTIKGTRPSVILRDGESVVLYQTEAGLNHQGSEGSLGFWGSNNSSRQDIFMVVLSAYIKSPIVEKTPCLKKTMLSDDSHFTVDEVIDSLIPIICPGNLGDPLGAKLVLKSNFDSVPKSLAEKLISVSIQHKDSKPEVYTTTLSDLMNGRVEISKVLEQTKFCKDGCDQLQFAVQFTPAHTALVESRVEVQKKIGIEYLPKSGLVGKFELP
jgi:hypothetical protein